MSPNGDLYTQQRYFFIALDPIHIGAGGYRLGRVDMTIAREPGTDLPKIPGTSLAGATRSYAAMRYGKPEAAGQHKKFKGDKAACPIIYTFGTATDTSTNSEGPTQAGTVSIGDARILFFPVRSMAGPLWVSTKEILEEAWGASSLTFPKNDEQKEVKPDCESIVTTLAKQDTPLNLGWLLFQAVSGLMIKPPERVEQTPEWKAVKGCIALVTAKLFSQIVNSNLEVRTSVSIDHETGAAEEGALFTYEAIPRTTWLWTDVIEDDYRINSDGASKFPKTSRQCVIERKQEKGENKVYYKDNEGAPLGKSEVWSRPLNVVSAGMRLIEYLGVGGMGTRGFGRMRLVSEWDVQAMEVCNEKES